ncbi:Fosmidomycin resistance protein [Alkalihalobacillus alcalophilus ATCC 27647 = CGMCC 1.3604]|uniref:Fosmidomycin resistance protein n=1 Tax=Alkalihalobacillus alcalophilus ATCC 27647 = CGMCC 1.3604 TaxID=1218173 RepID=J8TN90_ALKAL|nr:MFS transporter [Alkalihalobacillus alcalophilus]AFV25672.1 multidrug efflux transporter [Alkalihalobacillus alcalophilus ATCC 27647 = CGMCC 1.3604]MED1562844.1 MFS transporter [Alkalihalobacillus alcalophilus]THG90020.1 Fosmidomycin resistance protein [Alkalihalobacillus alcalophilus ATCC 27647 = CGMCC 1.3604]
MEAKQRAHIVHSQENKQPKTMYNILFIIGFVHLLNDSIQALVPAMFPILEAAMGLSYTQIGIIAFALNMTASVIQPVVGLYTDKKPSPYALPIGLCFTFVGVVLLAFAPGFIMVVIAVTFIGIGSAAFHPEGSRVAHMAAGNKKGLAQSIYQVGGNAGQALAPLITLLILVPLGQFGSIWFTLVAGLAIILLLYIAKWYQKQIQLIKQKQKHKKVGPAIPTKYRRKILVGFGLLLFLIFIRSWFHAGLANYYQFFAINEYGMTISQAQVYLFIFLAAGAIGTFAGGPLADRFGKRNILMLSMLGSAPFALLLPHVGPVLAYPLIGVIGFIILSSFSVAVVYGQELIPGKIGVVSGLIVGLAFGMGAIGAVIFGMLADMIGLYNTILLAVILPLAGCLTFLLPSDKWMAERLKASE